MVYIFTSAKIQINNEHFFLIEPRVSSIEVQVFNSKRKSEKLPRNVCIAKLEAEPTNDLYQASSLRLMVSDEYAMPLDKDIEAQIKKLDWTRLAKNFDY